MTAAEKQWAVNDIKTAVRVAGSHWFDPDTMRFFGTRVLDTVYQGPGGIYFVTSEKPPHSKRAYTVRKFTPPSDISTVGEVASRTIRGAKKYARQLAGENAQATNEEFMEVGELEQFQHDLVNHCKDGRTAPASPMGLGLAKAMMHHAQRHHKYMEAQCNGEWPYGRTHNSDDGHPHVVEECRSQIKQLAIELGAAGVIFSGDPRGCTVKLTFADGFTNDFGKEGYCVPTEE